MPFPLIAAAIAGVAGLGSAAISSRATSKAADAARDAADRNAQVSREAYQQTRADLQPYAQAGYAALPELQRALGLGGGQGGGATVSAAPQAPYASYVDANPDLAQAYASDHRAQGMSKEEFGQFHYQTYGQNEGRQLPSAQAQPTAQPAGAPSAAPAAQTPTDLITAERPDQPVWQDPGTVDPFQFDASRIAEDPGYKFRYDEALRAANTGYAARGLLKSGGAVKGIMDRASGLASQETQNAFQRQFATWQGNANQSNANRAFQYNVFAGDRANLNSNFNTDRGFQADQKQQGIANLFNLTNMGQSAAAGQANAGNIFANNTMSNNNQAAANIGNAAIANANNLNNLFGAGLQAYGMYQGSKAGGLF
ncbi:hypothetical protein [Phenylobacterium deserti]|uniref:DNA transfer protein p32 n=1 Tax=Phenylobacterium deserti TaxID=1914756 RepID=A0A328ABZ4_9CAUL|nr:hypothetical protein [Phenylobacterium deserti]RAK52139.1 hypothetical protein DJ018_13365 [Phenylobacterium deserti]